MILHLTKRSLVPMVLSLAVVSGCVYLGCAGPPGAARVLSPSYEWQAKPGAAKFLKSSFVSSAVGYSIVPHYSGVEVRRSNDGGDSWHSVCFLSGIRVVDFDFFNPAIGLMVVETTNSERRMRILRTTDHAVSWFPVFESDSLMINDLALDRKNGLDAVVIGSTLDQSRPSYLSQESSPFLLVSDDQGLQWRDDSHSVLRNVAAKEAMASAMKSVKLGWVILTSHGRMFARTSGDDTWNIFLNRNPKNLSYYPLGSLEDDDLWMIGGSGAIEGIRSSVSVLDEEWSHRDLMDWYITDAISIGYDGIMANAKVGKYGNMRRAGIYFSSDRGRSWSVSSRSGRRRRYLRSSSSGF